MLLALIVGTAGGSAFFALGLPLPWMLGALVVTMVAVVAGAPAQLPPAVRTPTITVIGVLIGSRFTPDLIDRAGAWLLSLAAMAVFLALVGLISVPFYRRIAGQDPLTAYFSAMPGGLAEMTTIGAAMGADDRKIVLAHAARIVVTVAAIAFWFRVVQGLPVMGIPVGPGLWRIEAADAAILAACAVAGAFLGVRLRLPAPWLFGPMILSAAVHAGGLTSSAPPGALVIAAQVILGTVMGSRFRGVGPGQVLRALGLSVLITAVTLAIAIGFAAALHRSFGQSAEQVLLAYAPGGLTEMSLIALAMQADVAYVALHHTVRIVLIIAGAPLALRLWRNRR